MTPFFSFSEKKSVDIFSYLDLIFELRMGTTFEIVIQIDVNWLYSLLQCAAILYTMEKQIN